MRLDEFLIGIANEQRNDLFTSANDGFDLSLEIVGNNVLVNDVLKKVILENKEKIAGVEKVIATKIGDISSGDIVIHKDQSWLITDVPVNNDVYLKAPLKLCNSTYPIKSNKTKVLKGYNQINKPIYEEVYEIDKLEPCIVEMGIVSTQTDKQLVIPENRMYITLKYQQSDSLQVDYEFTMYNSKYKVISIDYTKVINEKGIVKILAERV